jgi:hypothetical protein
MKLVTKAMALGLPGLLISLALIGVVWPAQAGDSEVSTSSSPPILVPAPAPSLEVIPTTLTLECEGAFTITIRNAGPNGSKLVISDLTMWHGYSQGWYGTGFSWDLSGIELPLTLKAGQGVRIPVSYSGRDQTFPSRLHLQIYSNAPNGQPYAFYTYFGLLCGTPTPPPTNTPQPSRG